MQKLEEGRQYTRISADLAASELGASAIRGAESLNQKVSALLTHVSIMVAICSAFLAAFGFDGRHKPDVIVVSEIICYLFICIMCLRSIWVSSNRSYKKATELSAVDMLILITMKRRENYRNALLATIIITVIFICNIIYYLLNGSPVTVEFLSEHLKGFFALPIDLYKR